MEKFYSSKTLLKLADGGGCIPHITPGSSPALISGGLCVQLKARHSKLQATFASYPVQYEVSL